MSKKAQEGSLGSKLLNLRPGEFIILPDEGQEGEMASQMERQVQNIIHKSGYLEGREFKTWRCDVIKHRAIYQMLGIERVK